MELGVSFTDLSQNSTFHGRNKNQNLRNSLKLSEYKMNNKSSFKPRMHSEGA